MDPLAVSLIEHPDLDAAEAEWRQLEPRADAAFFQTATWVFCRADTRYDRPVLLRARAGDRTVALALFNHRRSRAIGDTLWLGETGHPGDDDVFVEHNGPLLARDAPPGTLAACLAAAFRAPIGSTDRGGRRRLVLSGIDAAMRTGVAATGARILDVATRPDPWVDLASWSGGGHLAALSANTRYQLRRSIRRYETLGPITLDRAATLDEARACLDGLCRLHQRAWTRRDKPGAFANPAFTAFHRELVRRGLPRDEIDLLRLSAGPHVIGYLYNFRYRGAVAAYQSGFEFDAPDPHAKPGLTCHHLAIEYYASRGCHTYDLLAGGDRYKTSLAPMSREMFWIKAAPSRSRWAALWCVRDTIRAMRRGRALTPGQSR